MKNRVVITVIGVVSTIGCGKEAFWNSLIEGRQGIDPMSSLGLSPYRTTASPGNIDDFIKLLQEKLDEQLETPPNNKTIEKPF